MPQKLIWVDRVSEGRAAIVEAIKGAGPLKPKEIAEITGQNRATNRALLKKMLQDGQLDYERDGCYSLRDRA